MRYDLVSILHHVYVQRYVIPFKHSTPCIHGKVSCKCNCLFSILYHVSIERLAAWICNAHFGILHHIYMERLV